MDPVDRLLAIEEIKQLKAAYFHAIDTQDWDAFADLWTDDGVFDLTAEMEWQRGETVEQDAAAAVFTGGRVIADFCRRVVTPEVRSVHHGYDPVIEVLAPDQARGRWAMTDILDYGDRKMEGHGWYFEDYRRVAGRWRFARIDLRRLRTDWT
jgi:hypothetical protein